MDVCFQQIKDTADFWKLFFSPKGRWSFIHKPVVYFCVSPLYIFISKYQSKKEKKKSLLSFGCE